LEYYVPRSPGTMVKLRSARYFFWIVALQA